MDKWQLRQYAFGSIKESGIVKGLGGRGYDAMLDLLDKVREYGKDSEPDLGLRAFAYLFRRLGPPNSGCEPQYLARYVIPTPNDGINLIFNIGTEISIDVVARKEIASSYLDWYFTPIRAWWKRCNDWAMANLNKVVYDQSYGMMSEEMQQLFAPFLEKDLKEWELTLPQERQQIFIDGREKGKKSVFTKTDQQDFFQWKALQSEVIRSKYKDVEAFPLPSGNFETIYQWHLNLHTETDNDAAIIMFTAVNDTIRELIKPVLIDGVYCNVFGSVEVVSDETVQKEAQERVWEHAGNGFIEYDLTDYPNWLSMCIMAREKGNGDIQKGFQKVFAPHKNADIMMGRNKKPK